MFRSHPWPVWSCCRRHIYQIQYLPPDLPAMLPTLLYWMTLHHINRYMIPRAWMKKFKADLKTMTAKMIKELKFLIRFKILLQTGPHSCLGIGHGQLLYFHPLRTSIYLTHFIPGTCSTFQLAYRFAFLRTLRHWFYVSGIPMKYMPGGKDIFR